MRRLAVLRALPGLGDFLCATPALCVLRAVLPEAHITFVGLPWVDSLSSRYGLWDTFSAFPGAPGLPEVPFSKATLDTFMDAQRRRFDLVLQLHGSGPESSVFALELDAPFTAGFYSAKEIQPGPLFLPWDEREHEVTRWLRLLSHVGIRVEDAGKNAVEGAALSFPLGPEDRTKAQRARSEHNFTAPYLILHPGAASEAKRWPVTRFAEVGRAAQRLGLKIAITGSSEEADLAGQLQRLLPEAVNLAGKTELGTLAALLRGARLLVCNDTGVSHLAAATRTPSVVLFSETDPARWAPLDTSRHIAVDVNQNASTETVVAATYSLLGGSYEHLNLARPRGVPVLPHS